MSGALSVLVASQPGTRIVVTTANFGAPYGYRLSPSAGSISPTTYKGKTISEAYSQPSLPSTFRISFTDDSLAQSFFSQLSVQRDDGSFVTLLSSAASSFGNIAGVQTTWQWNGTGTWGTAGVNRVFYIL